jgi:hypothetical protein
MPEPRTFSDRLWALMNAKGQDSTDDFFRLRQTLDKAHGLPAAEAVRIIAEGTGLSEEQVWSVRPSYRPR